MLTRTVVFTQQGLSADCPQGHTNLVAAQLLADSQIGKTFDSSDVKVSPPSQSLVIPIPSPSISRNQSRSA